jgi:monoterpene epsilon-lactone hydrolase
MSNKGLPSNRPFAMTVSAEARAVMTPMLAQGSAPEMTATLMRNAITRKAVRAAAANHLKPLNKSRAKRFDVDSRQRARSPGCR